MATSSQNKEAHPSMTHSQRITIAEIDSQNIQGCNYHIEADIVLVWPYSSATRQLSLLLAERDVSLKATKGQVKATFHGAGARAVANARPGIGQSLKLSVKDASIEEEIHVTSTPGKKAGFTLHFHSDVSVRFSGNGQPLQAIDFTASASPSPPRNDADGLRTTGVYEFDTPRPDRPVNISNSHLSFGSAQPSWYSSPFTDDDDYTVSRRRKRTKFARSSGAWRLADASEDETEPTHAHSHLTTARENGTSTKPTSPASIVFSTRDALSDAGFGRDDLPRDPGAPPPTQYLPTPTAATATTTPEPAKTFIQDSELDAGPTLSYAGADTPRRQLHVDLVSPVEDHSTMPTPKLDALASPGLPLVSPLVPRTTYFPNLAIYSTATSELDASSQQQSSILDAFLDAAEAQAEPIDVKTPEEFPVRVDEVGQGTNPDAAFISITKGLERESSGVDLDSLQQQIDLEYATDEASEHAVENEAEGRHPEILPKSISENDHDFRGSESPPADTPTPQTSNRDQPIVLDSDDSSEDNNDRDIDDEVSAPDSHDGSTQGSVHIRATHSQNISGGPQNLPNDEIVLGPDRAVDDSNKRFVAGDHHEQRRPEEFVSLPDQRQIDESDDSDNANAASSASIEPDLTRSHRASLVNEALQIIIIPDPSLIETSETHADGTVPLAIEGTSVDPDEASADGWERLAQNLFAPYPTQTEPTIENVGVEQETVRPEEHMLNSTHSWEGNEMETPNVTQVETFVEQSAFQLDGPLPLPTPHRTLRGKAPAVDDLYSEYFTPRKTATVATNVPAKSDNTDASEAIPAGHVLEETTGDENETSEPVDYDPESRTASGHETGTGTHTSHGYYVRLINLTEYFNQLMDVLAVCTTDSTTPEKAKTGPKDFNTTLHLIDASKIQDTATITAQIFRPRKNVLPVTKRGDVVLLRNFKVQTQQRKPFLLSTDESSWAVFHRRDTSSDQYTTNTAGPPVELGDQEHESVISLFNWWSTQGHQTFLEAASTQSPVVAAQKPVGTKKAPPAPLDLRRSPRNSRQQRYNDGAFSPTSLPSPSPPFNLHTPYTPTVPSTLTTMPPPQRTTSHMSPASPRSTRSSPRQTRRQSRASLSSPTSSSPVQPLSASRPRTRSQALPVVPEQSTAVAEVTPHHVSDSVSVVESVSASSTSTRNRRLERRSTSLIHELRDGKEWVDVETSEVVSVSSPSQDGGSDDEHEEHTEAGEESLHTIENTNGKKRDASVEIPDIEPSPADESNRDADGSKISANDEPVLSPTTPTRSCGPGRRRASNATAVGKSTSAQTQPSEEQPQAQDPQPAEGRITRSKAAKGIEANAGASSGKDDNVHELRDGARYRD